MRRVASGLMIFALSAMGASAYAYSGQQYSKAASISLASARATAIQARPGKVTDEELEKEAGGSGLRYSFDIKDGAKTYEVGVDAKEGKVLENKAEGPNPD